MPYAMIASMARRQGDLRSLTMLPPGQPVDLALIDPRGTPGLPAGTAVRDVPKVWSRAEVARLGVDLLRHQEMLFANAKVAGDRRRVLLVLQAMDCGGKDGTVKAVAGQMNPLGLSIVAFGPPTEEELAHDFLWRIERAVPEPGYVGVFNRSHYEDVLVARVRSLVPKRVWQTRYDAINKFEAGLVADGVILLKVMLHISFEEQYRRLVDRLADPTKQWKFNPGDVDERDHWADYQAAYVDALQRCGTDHAPWHVVPADRKWYRNWAVANLLLSAFRDLGLEYPPVPFDVDEQRARLAAAQHRGNER
jgi:PPK2 family polyphosphate:nucleotide phosphotransferase